MKALIRGLREQLLAVGLIVLIWWLYVIVQHVPAYILPSPSDVFVNLVDLFTQSDVYINLAITFGEVIVGFLIGSLGGFALGYVVSKSRLLDEALSPFILLFQAAPKIALAPLFMVWFGLGMPSKMLLIISMVFFPVMVNTVLGIKEVPQNLRNLMRILDATRGQVFTNIELPYCLPYVFDGLRLGAVQAVIGAIVAEWMAGNTGLGSMMVLGSTTYNTDLLISAIVLTIVVGVVFYAIIERLAGVFIRWDKSKE